MVKNAYRSQFYGVALTLVLCSVTHRVAAIAILAGIIGATVTLVCIAIKSSFPEVEYPRASRRLKRTSDPPASSTTHPSNWENSDFARNHPGIARQLDEISQLLVQNYVSSWFQHIDAAGASGFEEAVKETVRGSVAKLGSLLEHMDGTGLLVLKLVPLLTKHFEAFRVARRAVQDDRASAGNTELQLAVEYNKLRKLHHCLSLRPSSLAHDVEVHLTAKMEKLLPFLIDEKELSSTFVFILLRDILAMCALKPLVMKLSNADFWNLAMISISDKVLEEQDQVSQVRRFLSRELEVQNSDAVKAASINTVSHVEQELRPGITGTQFELYLRQISQLSSVENLQKERLSIVAKLLRLRNDKSVLNSSDYQKRLLLSLNLLQTRLRSVDSRGTSTKRYAYTVNLADAMKIADQFESFLKTVKLTDILQEPKCSIYFEKFLTIKLYRRGLCYLNFWKLTENMRNPLEDAHEGLIVTISPWEIAQLRETALQFFQNEQLEFMRMLDPGLVTNILLFIKDTGSDTNRTFPLARRSILLLQSEAQRILEDDFFQTFKGSNIFLDMMASADFSDTESYARIVAESQFRELLASPRTQDRLTAIRVFTNPEVENAIEDILNRTSSERERGYIKVQQNGEMKGNPLEINDIELYKDTLFRDEDEDNEALSLRKRSAAPDEVHGPHLVENESIGGSLQKFADLKDEIARLTVSVDQIDKQLELLNHFILKAELTNNQKQLKLLRKSQLALIRDMDNKELLKQQLIICQNANSLYKKTKVAIKSYFVDSSHNDGRAVVYYLISVEHINKGQVATWTVPRRFNEFYNLHNYMKAKYKSSLKSVRHRESFPKKVSLFLSLQTREMLRRERKIKLERYIRTLLKLPEICQDDLLRKFLTDSTAFSESSIIITSINSKEAKESSSAEGSIRSLTPENDVIRQNNSSCAAVALDASDENDDEFSFFEDGRSSIESNDIQTNEHDRTFVKAICDMFISVFLLNKANTGWLRGRAIVTILQQLMGSAIEKYIVDTMARLTSESQISGFLTLLKDKLRENGVRRNERSKPERLPAEIERTRARSKIMFKCLFTEVCGKVVGLKNAQEAAALLHEMAQNSYLTTSLLLEILDTLYEELLLCSRQISCDTQSPKSSPVETRNLD
ncbi:hypothetical protein HG536_0H00750 [Torulaspora globosa]|uniref:PXA domain-containing protein n=1 Tax=Torulaspora globosa TaxID=48254 RepID=A0A7G3ZMG4_9SACH|nr:uncharacterized protein HG536_0H00750 [Torulaspora globosa]QLL34700.1 hypothetical protein HG536_0H00750 [Torulaspora globosa]